MLLAFVLMLVAYGQTEQIQALMDQGRIEQAIIVAEGAVANSQAGAPKNIAEAEITLGYLHSAAGHFDEGLAHFEAARDVIAGIDAGLESDAEAEIGRHYHEAGRLQEAREHLERAQGLLTDDDGYSRYRRGVLDCDLGGLLATQGDLKTAIQLTDRGLAAVREVQGEDNIQVAYLEGSYADLLVVAKEDHDEQVIGLLHHAISVISAERGDDHRDLVPMYNALGITLSNQGDLTRAIAAVRRAIEIMDAGDDRDGPIYPAVLNTLSRLLAKSGDDDEAVATLERAVQAMLAVRGPDHADLGLLYMNLAKQYMAREDWPRAQEAATQSEAIFRRFVADLLDATSEREALMFLARSRVVLVVYIDTFRGQSGSRAAYDAVLDWKGMSTRALYARRNRLPTKDPKVREQLDRLAEFSRSISQGVLAGAPPQQIETLRLQREALERELGTTHTPYRTHRQVVDFEAVCARLPAESALVDYVFVSQALGYQVFITRAGQCEAPIRVTLQDATALNEAIASWRSALTAGSNDARSNARGVHVREKLWDPIAAHLDGVERLIVVPDGVIASVPFAALPLEDGSLLVEHATVSHLDFAGDLLRQFADPAPASALLVGDVAYGETKPPCAGMSFQPLPGTAKEIRAISRYLPKVTKLTGDAATEDSVYAAARGKSVVHIASHGFFLSQDCLDPEKDGDIHPLVQSGLALAAGDTDGLWTAAEVAELDLGGTQMVVLSACDTARGRSQVGEGLMGLRRAFSAAGVPVTVMSLWPIPDTETAALMADFYRAAKRKRPAVALREAQLTALARNRALHGEARASEWAAFIAAGDWQ